MRVSFVHTASVSLSISLAISLSHSRSVSVSLSLACLCLARRFVALQVSWKFFDKTSEAQSWLLWQLGGRLADGAWQLLLLHFTSCASCGCFLLLLLLLLLFVVLFVCGPWLGRFFLMSSSLKFFLVSAIFCLIGFFFICEIIFLYLYLFIYWFFFFFLLAIFFLFSYLLCTLRSCVSCFWFFLKLN